MPSVRPKDAAPVERVRQRGWQKRSLETRDKIIQAAAHAFALHGFEGASTRHIAVAADVQHTLVTYHFKTKEGLWQATLFELGAQRRKKFEARLAGLRGVDEVQKLYLYLEDFVQFHADDPDYSWIMSHVASRPSPQLDWLIENAVGPGFESVAAMIRAAQQRGKFVEGDPKYLFYLFIGMASRIFMLSSEVEKVLGRSPFDPDFVKMHVRTCLSLFFRDVPQDGAGLAESERVVSISAEPAKRGRRKAATSS